MERIKNTAGRVERKEARIDRWGRGRVKIVFPRPDASGSLTERIGDISRDANIHHDDDNDDDDDDDDEEVRPPFPRDSDAGGGRIGYGGRGCGGGGG